MYMYMYTYTYMYMQMYMCTVWRKYSEKALGGR